jgi:hypothetical protein
VRIPRLAWPRLTAVVVGLALLASFTWFMFGFTSRALPDLGSRLVFHRFFGRVVSVDVYAGGTPTPIERHVFSWSQPYGQGDPASCAGLVPETWQDWNRDGKWDTWLRNLDPGSDGECQTQYEVDTLGTGKPDWTFVANYGDYEQSKESIIARRGF